MENIECKDLKRKIIVDKAFKYFFLFITALCALIIIFIGTFIVIKGFTPFIKKYEISDNLYSVDMKNFLIGNFWYKSPNLYGAGFIIVNTIYITCIALILAVPISILTALFITRIAPKWFSKILKSVIELLASIPSVIYGLFGLGVITIFVKNTASLFGVQSSGGLSVLSAALVLAIMIMPTITMISTTAIQSVKNDIILGSLALGASMTETNFKVVLTSAKSGIFSGIILGIGRALGEATAVSMVCGNAGSGPNFNLFETTRTLTSTMLLGIHETSGMDYDIRFSIGILLIGIILITNVSLNLLKNRIGKASGK